MDLKDKVMQDLDIVRLQGTLMEIEEQLYHLQGIMSDMIIRNTAIQKQLEETIKMVEKEK